MARDSNGRPLRVHNATRDRLLASQGIEASTFRQRFIGLMGRKELPLGEGLLIRPCNSIHTFFMRIAIDAAFLDRDDRIVKRYDALPPWRATAVHFKAVAVLELPAGTLLASGTQEGDLLRLEFPGL